STVENHVPCRRRLRIICFGVRFWFIAFVVRRIYETTIVDICFGGLAIRGGFPIRTRPGSCASAAAYYPGVFRQLCWVGQLRRSGGAYFSGRRWNDSALQFDYRGRPNDCAIDALNFNFDLAAGWRSRPRIRRLERTDVDFFFVVSVDRSAFLHDHGIAVRVVHLLVTVGYEIKREI